MPELLRKYWPYLEVFNSIACAKTRKAILKEFSKDPNFCKLLRQVAKNTLRKNFEIDSPSIKKLRKQKKSIIKLTKKYKNRRQSQKVIVQRGSGFLPLVIPLLAQVIGSLINEVRK